MLALLLIAYGTSDNTGVQDALKRTVTFKKACKGNNEQLIDLANSTGAGV